MKYLSTRGRAPEVSFEAALLSGLAPDGGLYLPASWPSAPARREGPEPFSVAAARILYPFVEGWIGHAELAAMTARAFSRFDHDEVAPLVSLDDGHYLLELFHGPTLAFKDVAMQLLAAMVDHALGDSGRRLTIVGATSGDTGAAAIEAFRGRSNIDIFILHPEGRVSDVQRRMMTTVADENVHNLAVAADFDACQRIVKSLFADRAFVDEVSLSGVNSINWARLAIQCVYYFTALAQLERATGETTADFSVPTGNFGDAFAGYVAREMGAGVRRICLAVNRNDILHRALSTGAYRPGETAATMSPSMDIEVASNFERLLFEASGRNAGAVSSLMETLVEDGGFEIPDRWRARIGEVFTAERIDEEETAATMASVHASHGMLIDPHTAVGIAAARRSAREGAIAAPVITLSTAHPAKFPDAVERATGVRAELPPRAAAIDGLAERATRIAADTEKVRSFIIEALGGRA